MKQLPVAIVGGNGFGRYPIISREETFNMIVSDDFLVPFAGYKKVLAISEKGSGRGLFNSVRFGNLIAVIDNGVYIIGSTLHAQRIGSLETFEGDVLIAENEKEEIALCDHKDIFIFNYRESTFKKAVLDFIPSYVSYHNGRFLSCDREQAEWRLCGEENSLVWPADASHVGEFQTKADNPLAVIPLPGRGNSLFVMGSSVTECWTDIGMNLFPYQRASSFNIDYGCLNPATIASSDEFIVWLAANEKSGPVLMLSDGGSAKQISTEGINFKLSQLKKPNNAYGFLFKQDGHLLYVISFPDDELTYAYDFATRHFFTLTNHQLGAHSAKRAVFYHNSYYFISFMDGHIYELNSRYTDGDEKEIPRIRITAPIRSPDTNFFITQKLVIPIEQGHSASLQRVDLSLSKDGGVSFSANISKTLNPLAHRQNRLIWWQLGRANHLTLQLRFWSFDRFVVGNGCLSLTT
ncbi:hypothetical protein [Rickettsiella endosymbiont of Miltochrista miniata]|uniref:hypothetical protein n=1 Tax=Rickettsiella endosymbiont of Miltochrista miniata TaxID=3066239 RepID=UPI00313E9761